MNSTDETRAAPATANVRDEAEILAARARRLAARSDDDAGDDDGLELLTFSLGGERYALPLAAIARVEPIRWWAPVPGAPPRIAGVVNLQGEVRPLADLARILGVESARENGFAVEIRDGRVCLRVDALDRVVSIAREALNRDPDEASLLPDAFVLAHAPGGLTVLDADALRADALTSEVVCQ